jgi:hypothetical protein
MEIFKSLGSVFASQGVLAGIALGIIGIAILLILNRYRLKLELGPSDDANKRRK